PGAFWRDLVAFTWNLRTFEGRDAIASMLGATLGAIRPSAFLLGGPVVSADGVDEARITFETAVGRGEGYVRLRDGRAWTLLTRLTELKGHEEKRGPRRELGVEHGVHRNRRTWLEAREAEAAELGVVRQPYCLIIGGGQGGLSLGARLRRLDVPTIILESNARPGDGWRRRYKSLCLHDPVWYDHLPYLPFPDHWPVFTPKDRLAEWLEFYARVMELDVWTSSTCRRARFDAARGEWEVVVDRAGIETTLRPKQLVLATGMAGVPDVPSFPGMETFRGQQHHSSRHPSGEAYAGKRCVIIGANNSAHDIAADLWEHGADVTMVQRSPTTVVRSESMMEFAWKHLYSEQALARGVGTDLADLLNASVPHRLVPERQKPIYDAIRAHDHDHYARLEKAGFMLDFGEDDSGLAVKYARRGSGYYIDVGASALVADGQIKLRSRVEVARIGERGVVLSDGSELPADLIVYATGFGSMNGWAAQLISQEVADKVGKCWGLGSGTAKDPGPWEGELRNMWKPTQQEGLWFMGGNLAQARFFSLTLALQLKARQLGMPTPVHALQPVHHRA
ncbi:MAG: NAD(P)/FAD-dependent oxidoreductase, partial [Alphaproteobacteria bacterium]|nr:NAD(P)/FAD-dependent oxidoreductase [Alphaproteobacteria bacterium]